MLRALLLYYMCYNAWSFNREIEVVGTMDWRGPYGLAKGSGYKEFTTTVKINSKEDKKKIRDLVKLVHRSCPAYNTIVNPVPIHNILYLNGSRLK